MRLAITLVQQVADVHGKAGDKVRRNGAGGRHNRSPIFASTPIFPSIMSISMSRKRGFVADIDPSTIHLYWNSVKPRFWDARSCLRPVKAGFVPAGPDRRLASFCRRKNYCSGCAEA